jgi:FMN phosphatase YigB (HAD superfamily)
MKIVIFDLDGTLANIDHRLHFIENDNKDWNAFYKACKYDKPIKQTIEILRMLNTLYDIHIFSGRGEIAIDETVIWLGMNGIPYSCLKMRKDGDFSSDEKLKENWLKGYDKKDIYCVFEDRKKVAEMWRKNGIMCFQVANGDF